MELQPTILLVDDEPFEREVLKLMLQEEGYLVTPVAGALGAMVQLEEKQFDIVLAGVQHVASVELLKEIKRRNIESEVILITAYGEIRHAVAAIREGAYGFLEKSQNIEEELKLTIKRALEKPK